MTHALKYTEEQVEAIRQQERIATIGETLKFLNVPTEDKIAKNTAFKMYGRRTIERLIRESKLETITINERHYCSKLQIEMLMAKYKPQKAKLVFRKPKSKTKIQ